MALGFKVRSANRDKETDAARFGRLEQAFADLVGDLEKEQAGLQQRYQSVADDAGFSLLALEDRGKDELSSRVDDLTTSIKGYRDRLTDIEDHLALIATLRAQLADHLSAKARA